MVMFRRINEIPNRILAGIFFVLAASVIQPAYAELDPAGCTLMTNQTLQRMGYEPVTAHGAIGDGVANDTQAIKDAIRVANEKRRVVYLHPGNYRVEETLEFKQDTIDEKSDTNQNRFGQQLLGSYCGSEKPTITLADGIAPETDEVIIAPKPFPVILLWRDSVTAQGPDDGHGGKDWNQVVRNVKIVLGNNPGAVGIRHAGAEGSSIQEVTIIASGGFAGLYNLNSSGGYTYDVDISGGEYGIYQDESRGGSTLVVGLTLSGQAISPIAINSYTPFGVVGFDITHSDGRIISSIANNYPAQGSLEVNSFHDSGSHVYLVDGKIDITGGSNAIIENNGVSVYFKNVYVKGQADIVVNDAPNGKLSVNNTAAWRRISEYSYTGGPHNTEDGHLIAGSKSNDTFLNGNTYPRTTPLMVSEQFNPPSDLVSQHRYKTALCNVEGSDNLFVTDYGADPNDSNDDTAEIQSAITAATTGNNRVFLPASRTVDAAVAHLTVDESAGITAADASANTHDGALVNMDNANWVAGILGNALNFVDADEYVSVPDQDDLDLDTAVTVSAWINPSALDPQSDGTQDIIITKGTGTALNYRLNISNTTNKVQFRSSIAGVVRTTTSTTILQTGTWYHIAGTYDGTHLKIFVNGLEQNSQSYTGSMAINAEPIIFGQNPGNSESFVGVLDDACIYSAALSADDINSLYNGGVGKECIDTADDEAYDLSGTYKIANTLTLDSDTQLCGVTRYSSVLDASDWTGATSDVPVIQTSSDVNATSAIADFMIRIPPSSGYQVNVSDPNNPDYNPYVYAIEWQSGANSLYRDVYVQRVFGDFGKGVATKITGNGGGKWYGVTQHGAFKPPGPVKTAYRVGPQTTDSLKLSPDARHMLIDGTTAPLHFYPFHCQHMMPPKGALCEIKNASNVSIFGIKSEMGSVPKDLRAIILDGSNTADLIPVWMYISGSDNIDLIGYEGSSQTTTGRGLFEITNSNHVTIAQMGRRDGIAKDLNEDLAKAENLWFFVKDDATIGLNSITAQGFLGLYKSDSSVATKFSVAHLALNESTGATAIDASGNGHTGALNNITNASWVPGILGGALDFIDLDDVVTIADSDPLDLAERLTVSTWIKPSSFDPQGDGGQDIVLTKGSGTDLNYRLSIIATNDVPPNYKAQFRAVIDGTLEAVAASSTFSQAGDWHHIAGTYDGINFLIYVDGALAGSKSVVATTGIATNTSDIVFGQSSASSTAFAFSGLIDDTCIYDIPLTATDIASLYNGGIGAVCGSTVVDTDGDGLSDSVERSNGFDPGKIDTDGDGLIDGQSGIVTLAEYPGGLDDDNDGYVDGEQTLGTNPALSDTDGDGYSDSAEITAGTDPLDINSAPSNPVAVAPLLGSWWVLVLMANFLLLGYFFVHTQTRKQA